MFVNQFRIDTPHIFDQIIDLTKSNLIQVGQYFNPQLLQEINLSQTYSRDNKTIQQNIMIPSRKLNKLHEYLQMMSIILMRKFTHLNYGKQTNQYAFLRRVWVRNHNKVKMYANTDVQDRFDSLNQTISMIKLRTRHLMQKQQYQYKQFWNQQYRKSINLNSWDHPLLQKINKDLNNAQMRNQELILKINQISQQNVSLANKNIDYETKLSQYKDKNKKMQKQMFEMAKKKSQLQKQLIINTKNAKQQNLRNNLERKANKQNQSLQESDRKKQVQFIMLMKQDEQKSTPSKQAMSHYNPMSIKEKYRHAKNVVKRSAALVSPNSSIDSIKNVRFERTSVKKLLIKGQ